MTVHGRSIIEFWDTRPPTGGYSWVRCEQGDLQRLELVDAVYRPMKAHLVISNADMNHKLSDDSNIASGIYTVEGEVDNPTFHRFQPIRIFHNPRALYTDVIAHDGDGSGITFTLSSHGLLVGQFINVMNESTGAMADGTYKVRAVTTNTFTLFKKGVGTSATSRLYSYTVAGTGDSGTVVMVVKSEYSTYPIFFGRIDSVDVNYSDQIGKTINITASDYLANLQGELITRSFVTPPLNPEDFSQTSMEAGTEVGKYQEVTYDNQKLSDTIKEVVTDWSYGRDIFTDNTYDGTNSLGEAKFEGSSFEFAAQDEAAIRRFAGRDTKVLDAMKNIAMTERHAAAAGAEGGAGTPEAAVYNWIDEDSTNYGTWASADETGKDVVIYEEDHGYVDGNLVEFKDNSGAISHASYIVSAKTDDYFKIKTLQGAVVQQTVPNPATPQACTIAPGLSGSFGYDFYLDTGMYRDNANENSLDAHKPHLNYFMRGTRPIDPEATGLSLIYPQDYDETEDEFGWGVATDTGRINLTKVHLMPTFDHGMYTDDLYSHVGLRNVDTDDRPGDIGDLGHKMEMLKINSIANEDWVAQLTTGHLTYSGSDESRGRFHWERDDSASGLEWLTTGSPESDNIHFFGNLPAGATGYAQHQYKADGTTGALQHLTRNNEGTATALGGAGNITPQTNNGLAGLSRVPDSPNSGMGVGRPFIDPPSTGSEMDHGAADYGATAIVPADLIKDVYNVEYEGLLGPIVAADAHSVSTSAVLIDKTAHQLESGNIIKIVEINSATSDVGGLTVNTAPTRVNPDSDTTNTGSYYRVERVTADSFYITDCQKHRLNTARKGFSSGVSGTFKYRVAYNVFKHACRVQWASGHTWSTKTEDTVLRTEETGKGADYMLISDVRKADKPYKGIQVNALIQNSTENNDPADLPGLGGDDTGVTHPTSGVFGWTTVPHTSKEASPFSAMPRFNESTSLTPNPDNASADFTSDSKTKVKFAYGDYISETRFLYSDDNLVGVIGREQHDSAAAGEGTSNDLFKSTKAKILSRMVNEKNISKTYTLQYNDSAASRDSVRDTVAQILKRAIIPAKRTTCKIVGYPVIKLTGPAQDGTTSTSLEPVDNPVAYGGRAGMMVEKTLTLDGAPIDLTFAESVTSAAVGGDLFSGSWGVGNFYRMFIYLRAGNSVRVEHTAAGVKGNHIITKLTYYERLGTTETTIETTGYDEALLSKFGPLSELVATIKRSGDRWGEPKFVTPKKLSKNPFVMGG
ncbi:hypothetical protein CMI47_22460 [Candidatus Pacearchaeota archaeon]|nr:hypothetical protein [Candidatus Pacearchaeota archaeon]